MNKFIVFSLLFLIGTMFMADICAVITYSTSVRRPYLDDKIVNTRLLWKQTSEGLGPCVGVCARNSSCASVFYNKETRYCHGHSITHGTVASSDAEENNATRYYVQPFGMHSCYTPFLFTLERIQEWGARGAYKFTCCYLS